MKWDPLDLWHLDVGQVSRLHQRASSSLPLLRLVSDFIAQILVKPVHVVGETGEW